MFVDPLAEETFEPYSYTGNNPIMFTDPTEMSKEGGENRYEGVWNHCEEKYDYTLINDDGGNLVDTIEYKGGAMDGKTLDYPVYQDVERYSKPASSEPRVKELARRPGYQKISINKFNGHAIEPVSINGTLSDLIVDYVSEITGSPYAGIALGIATGRMSSKLGIIYSPTKKHMQGGWGTYMDLDDDIATSVLSKSIQAGKQRYNYHNGKMYEFQPDNVGGYHGYPIKGTEAPPAVLKQLKANGTINMQLIKNC